MADSPEEFQFDFGAINANTAAGFSLDAAPYISHFHRTARIAYVLVDNQSEANVVVITEPSRPRINAGERKNVPLGPQTRDLLVQVDATITAGQLLGTVGIFRGGK